MLRGHELIMQEFGVTPRVAWQIDPFGHSMSSARLFAEMGFDAYIFSRLDYQERAQRLENKTMEYIFRPQFNHLGKEAQLFTYAMYELYYPPSGLNWD